MYVMLVDNAAAQIIGAEIQGGGCAGKGSENEGVKGIGVDYHIDVLFVPDILDKRLGFGIGVNQVYLAGTNTTYNGSDYETGVCNSVFGAVRHVLA